MSRQIQDPLKPSSNNMAIHLLQICTEFESVIEAHNPDIATVLTQKNGAALQ